MAKPEWYEVITQVHGREAVQEVCPSADEAIVKAEDSLQYLKEDLDTAFWSIQILGHWCDRESADAIYCECWRLRAEVKYAEVVGETIDDLGGIQ